MILILGTIKKLLKLYEHFQSYVFSTKNTITKKKPSL